jgi:hypothetical protein
MIQLKSFADDGRVVVKVTLPEAVMKHHDGQRFLSLGESKGPRLWPSKGGTPRVEDLANSKESDGVLRNVVAGDSQVP